jgi:hypothetical protein
MRSKPENGSKFAELAHWKQRQAGASARMTFADNCYSTMIICEMKSEYRDKTMDNQKQIMSDDNAEV